jgi:hypothetical protein
VGSRVSDKTKLENRLRVKGGRGPNFLKLWFALFDFNLKPKSDPRTKLNPDGRDYAPMAGDCNTKRKPAPQRRGAGTTQLMNSPLPGSGLLIGWIGSPL